MRLGLYLRMTACALSLGVGLGVGAMADAPKTVGVGGNLLGPRGSPMMLRADQVDYNLNTAVTVAHGHVEIDYNDRIVQADQVVYDQNKDVVTAEGHVVMMAPDGTVVFSTHAVLTDQMRDGVIEAMSALIGANGKMASPHAVRTENGGRMVAQPGVFTACRVCNKPGQRTPLWSVTAQRIVYDEVGHRIYYRNAVINFMGEPVFFTPLFSHPDPTVKHSSGILQPEVGSHTTLGYYVRAPLYIALTDSQDTTLAPLVAQRGGEQLEWEYRQRWDDGGLWWQASVANDPHGGLYGNLNQTYTSVFGGGIIPLDSTWHIGFDAQLTSYATYLQRFDMTTAPRLTNDLYLEGINGLSRFSVTGYFFEGLQATDNNSLFPVILPLVDYTYVPQRTLLGGDFKFDFNTTAASTRIAENDQRASGQATLRWPFVAANGQLLTIQAQAKGDVYHISDVNALGPTGMSNDEYVVRGAPYLAMDWRWPFVSPGIWGMNGFVVQPIAQILAAPYGDNPKQLLQLNNSAGGILNGDSADFELDETNIFDFDRLPGYDLVESGPRATVGTEMEALYPSGSVDFLVGQSYRLKPDPVLGEVSALAGSGFGARTSDLVSRLTVNFLPNVSVSDRIDYDTNNNELARNEVYVDVNYGRSSVEIDYLHVPPAEELLGLDTREEVKGQALIGLWDYWVIYAAAQRDLAASEMISEELGLGYQDECFGVSISYRRNFTQFRDLVPSSSWLFRINLSPSEPENSPTRIFPAHLYSGEVL